MDSFTGIIAVILIFGLPVVAVVMSILAKMNKRRHEKEIRQLIIENHTDSETAKLLIDEPKKQKKQLGPVNLETLRTACVLLGLGLGAFIYWGLKYIGFADMGKIELGLLIAFGIGVGMLTSFLVEMRLYKKYGNQPGDKSDQTPDAPAQKDSAQEV